MSIERKKVTRAIRRMPEEEPGPVHLGGAQSEPGSEEVSFKVKREDGGIQPGEGGRWGQSSTPGVPAGGQENGRLAVWNLAL